MRVVIVGAGKVGFNIADHLSRENIDVVIIERDPQRLKKLESELDVQVIRGSGSSPRILSMAHIAEARMIVAVTDSDEVNLTACLIADSHTDKIIKIARIRDPEIASMANNPDRFGLKLDLAINPEAVAAETILRHLKIPQALEIVSFAEDRVQLVGVSVGEGSPVIHESMAEVRAKHPEFLVAALARDGEVIIPTGKDRIQEGDVAYVVSSPETIGQTMAYFGKSTAPIRNTLIFGGTVIGQLIARRAEQIGIGTKIIASAKSTCDLLAEQLDRTIVLQGEGTDEDLLREEHISEVDSFIAVSSNEESNLVASTLAKSLGASSVISLTDNPAYIPMAHRIGIDITVSPRLLAISSILHYIRRGKVLAVTAFSETNAEALEFVALETSEVVGKPLSSIQFPKGAIIGAVVRDNQTLIPSGQTVIQPHDHVVVFAQKNAIHRVENALMLKWGYS